MIYRCECNCKWCANLDATPCSVIEEMREQITQLIAIVNALQEKK